MTSPLNLRVRPGLGRKATTTITAATAAAAVNNFPWTFSNNMASRRKLHCEQTSRKSRGCVALHAAAMRAPSAL
jgi:hypothetical protein